MIRRICNSLARFGAVAAVLMLALPVDAEESDAPWGDVAFDVMIMRPLQFTRLVAGLPFFVFYPFTMGTGYTTDVVAQLWTDPVAATFLRPLGERMEDFD